MINECIENDSPFGIVLLKEGRAEGPLNSDPYEIGTTAHIRQVEKLAFGRMNILVVGRDRFRINTLIRDKSYLSADVELMPFDNNEPEILASSGPRLRSLLLKYLGILEKVGQIQFDAAHLPEEPVSLSYLAAVVLQTEIAEKQALLEAENSTQLTRALIRTYSREVHLLDAMLRTPEDDAGSSFSLN